MPGLGRDVAALDHLGISLDHLERRLSPSVQNRMSSLCLPMRRSRTVRSGSQAGSEGSTYSLSRGASGKNPSNACVSMKTEPAAHAWGTFAPIY